MPDYNQRLKDEWRQWEYLEERDALRERNREMDRIEREEENQIIQDRNRDSNKYNNFNSNYNNRFDEDF